MTAPVLNPAPVAIECAAQCDREEWDAFVKAHKDGSFFHLSGWATAVSGAYGYDANYITARRNGDLTGALCLNDIRAPLLGRSLVSTAFSVGGGPLEDDEDTRTALLDAAVQLGRQSKVKVIECRSDFEAPHWLEKTGTHANFSMRLINDGAAALTAIPRKRRAEIRKAIEAAQAGSLSIRHDGGPDIFYRLYARSLRGLGTPVFPRKFLDALLDQFWDETEISIVEHQGEPVAALVTFYYKETALPYYVGATENARGLRAFDFLYWSVMRRAAARGCDTFDFGRSKVNSGAYAYKKLWGIEPEPLSYRIKLITATHAPDINASNPKFALFTNLWPRLPLAVTNRLGPLLAPNFP